MLVVDVCASIGGGLMEQGRDMISRSIGISKVPSRLIIGGSGMGMLVYGI